MGNQACLGADRKIGSSAARGKRGGGQSTGGSMYDRIMDTWQHNQGVDETPVSNEETYIVEKQHELNLHFVQCSQIKKSFQKISQYTSVNQDIDKVQLYEVLAEIKLLNSNIDEEEHDR